MGPNEDRQSVWGLPCRVSQFHNTSRVAIPHAQPAPVERAVPTWRLTLVATMTWSRCCCLSQVPTISSDLPTVASDMGALYASAVSAPHRKERPSQGGRGAASMHGEASHTTDTSTCTESYGFSLIHCRLTLMPLFLYHTWPDKPQAEYAEGIEALLVHFLR
jgi:hypothetical protein